MSWDTIGFKEKLESQHTFPGEYIFKFIVPSTSVNEVEILGKGGKISKRESSNGNYISVTILAVVNSADDVISTYRNASQINGCIAL